VVVVESNYLPGSDTTMKKSDTMTFGTKTTVLGRRRKAPDPREGGPVHVECRSLFLLLFPTGHHDLRYGSKRKQSPTEHKYQRTVACVPVPTDRRRLRHCRRRRHRVHW